MTYIPSPYCTGKPHQRIEVIKRLPINDKPLLIREVGICKRCKGKKYYERITEVSFNGSLASNPRVELAGMRR